MEEGGGFHPPAQPCCSAGQTAQPVCSSAPCSSGGMRCLNNPSCSQTLKNPHICQTTTRTKRSLAENLVFPGNPHETPQGLGSPAHAAEPSWTPLGDSARAAAPWGNCTGSCMAAPPRETGVTRGPFSPGWSSVHSWGWHNMLRLAGPLEGAASHKTELG